MNFEFEANVERDFDFSTGSIRDTKRPIIDLYTRTTRLFLFVLFSFVKISR